MTNRKSALFGLFTINRKGYDVYTDSTIEGDWQFCIRISSSAPWMTWGWRPA
jgi:hypothetical protein